MASVTDSIYRHAHNTIQYARDTAHDVSSSAISGSKQLVSSAQSTWQSNKPALERIISRILFVVDPLLKITIGIVLFASQSTPYVIGIFATIIAPECMYKSVARINQLWNNLSLPFKAIALMAGIIAFPITTAAAAFFAGVYTVALFIPQAPHPKGRFSGNHNLSDNDSQARVFSRSVHFDSDQSSPPLRNGRLRKHIAHPIPKQPEESDSRGTRRRLRFDDRKHVYIGMTGSQSLKSRRLFFVTNLMCKY